MRPYILYALWGVFLASCETAQVKQPEWLNPQYVVALPHSPLRFSTEISHWQVSLLTFTQPISLTPTYSQGILKVNLLSTNGITEGPATLCLFTENQYFFYPVELMNTNNPTSVDREYRSPKTVNPDSSLHQQRILHSIDAYRNLIPHPGGQHYFFEEEITLKPTAGVFRVDEDDPLSAYYVQPGSCTQIPIQEVYRKAENCFFVNAGPLTDAFNNTVADGTVVVFTYNDAHRSYRMEAPLQDGFAKIIIPSDSLSGFVLQARVHNTISPPILLIP